MRMINSADAMRRWLGMLCLSLAAGMLIWGQTILQPWLDGILFIIFWSFCFLFTTAAIILGLVDLTSIRRRFEQERQNIIHRALEEMEAGTEEKIGPRRK
jgi:hypothetical protein